MSVATRMREAAAGSFQLPAPLALMPAAVDLTGTANFYIDSVNGVDTNNGTSSATPWKTLAKITTGNGVAAGSIIALKCGSTFRELLPTPIAGASGNPVKYGCYGSGALPKIKGSKLYTGLSWSVNSGSIYVASAAAMPTSNNAAAWVDETTTLRKMASLAAVVAPGQYFADTTNSLLYVWMPDSSNPTGHTFEIAGAVSQMVNCTRSYVEFTDLHILHGGQNNACFIFTAGQTNVNVRRCHLGPTSANGVVQGSSNCVVEDCYFQSCRSGDPYPATQTVASCTFTTGTGNTFRRNAVTDCYYGLKNSANTTLTAYRNRFWLNWVNGPDNNGGAAPSSFYNNSIFHRPTTPNGHGIDIQGGDGYLSYNNLVISDYSNADASNVELFCGAGGTAANVDEDYCIGYRMPGCTANYGKVATTLYATAAAYWAAFSAAYGASNAHSLEANPLCVDPANGDFRLKAGSPARNAGVVIAGVTDGYTGSAPDIGAVESLA